MRGYITSGIKEGFELSTQSRNSNEEIDLFDNKNILKVLYIKVKLHE